MVGPQTTRNGIVAIDARTTRADEAWNGNPAGANDDVPGLGMMPSCGSVRGTTESDIQSGLGLVPSHPFSLDGGGWGAWEIGGRVSMIDLNDQLGLVNGVAGGRQLVYTVALNWCVNRNVRFMLDYLHGDVARQLSPINFTDAGSKFNAFAMRTQVTF
jgi:hypothetical protein